jgi:hypothetical protein
MGCSAWEREPGSCDDPDLPKAMEARHGCAVRVAMQKLPFEVVSWFGRLSAATPDSSFQ